jgi:hypothetical protein
MVTGGKDPNQCQSESTVHNKAHTIGRVDLGSTHFISGLIALLATFGAQATTVAAAPDLSSRIVASASDRLPPMEAAATTASHIVIPQSEGRMLAQLTATPPRPVQASQQSHGGEIPKKVADVSIASSQAHGSGSTGSIVPSERASRASVTDPAVLELRRERVRSHAELLSATPWAGNPPVIPFSNTLWLIGTGMIGLALIARRRNRKTNHDVQG